MIYFYGRISSIDQNESRQIQKAEELGIPSENIYIDKQSGKDFERPKYQKLKTLLVPGDEIIVSEISRFGRNFEESIKEYDELKSRGNNIKFLDFPIEMESTNILLRVFKQSMLQIQMATVEQERLESKERQRQGIALAKKNGTVFGPKKKLNKTQVKRLKEDYVSKTYTIRELCETYKITKPTLYNYINKY